MLDLHVEFLAAHSGLIVGKKAKDKKAGYLPTPRKPRRLFYSETANRKKKDDSQKVPLLKACEHFQIPTVSPTVKKRYRELSIRGMPFSEAEKHQLLWYCSTDVEETLRLFLAMVDDGLIDLNLALRNGDFVYCATKTEELGIPLDPRAPELLTSRPAVKMALIKELDSLGVYNAKGRFKFDLFDGYLRDNKIPWKRTEVAKRPVTKQEDFWKLAAGHPDLMKLAKLKGLLDQLKAVRLNIGLDGRARSWVGPFCTDTGRNAPNGTEFIFTLAKVWRGLIMPARGYALIYLDYATQEPGILAALSNDPVMMADYQTGLMYMAFAIGARMAPPGATAETHPKVRKRAKVCVLGAAYGQTAWGLARELGIPVEDAEDLVRARAARYSVATAWQEERLARGLAKGEVASAAGRKLFGINTRTRVGQILNHPVQATGSDILHRLAIKLTKDRVRICAYIHDAVLVECLEEEVDAVETLVKRRMVEAGQDLLRGFELQVDSKVIRWPNHFSLELEDEQLLQRVLQVVDGLS